MKQYGTEPEPSTDRLKRLQQLLLQLGSSSGVGAIAETVVDFAASALSADAAALYLAGRDGAGLEQYRHAGHKSGPFSLPASIAVDGAGSLATAAREQRAYFGAPVSIQNLTVTPGDLVSGAEAALPLLSGSRTIGLLCLRWEHDLTFTEEDELYLSTSAAAVALALEKATLTNQEERRPAVLDERANGLPDHAQEQWQEFPNTSATQPQDSGVAGCTDLVQANEDSVHESESRFRSTFEQAAVGVAHVALDGSWIRVNDRLCAILGYDREELLKTKFQVVTHPGDLQFDLDQVQRLLHGKAQSYTMEKRYVRKDGSIVWANLTVSLMRNERQEPLHFISVVEDISARKNAEDALRASEASLRAMADAMPQLSWIARADGYIYWYNRRWYEYTGTTPEEMAGWGWQSVHSPSYLDEVVRLWRESIATGQSFEMIFPLRGADGEYRSFLTRVEPLCDEEGQVLQWFGTNTDVDELKRVETMLRESEAKYRNLFQSITEEVHFWQVVRDQAGEIATWRLVDANPPALATWGRGSIDEVRGLTTDEIFGPGATEHYMPVVKKVMSEKRPYVFEDYFTLLGRYFQFTTVPLGEYFITTGLDITTIKALNLRLQRAMTETHHRVRNNLQILSAMIDLQGSAKDGMVPAAEFTRLSQHVQTLANIHTLLMEQAKEDCEARIITVQPLIKKLMPLYNRLAGSHTIQVEAEEIQMPTRQATALALVTNELISNAVKYGRSRIDVSLTQTARTCRLQVVDDGPGFPVSFDPGTDGHTGLELVSNLVGWDLGGTVAFESIAGGGGRVTVAFPLPDTAQ